ncbi:hypothetical protein [Haloarchaeobius amylolyticus]|uniref:hypothetical protein n=1 Tax=Haloarchaeobius amylolyticus TaxID=1198296 RepID=UPI00226DD184|nr:hypothetical protein [Haloarchaeobius amylolyticus]
MIIQTLVYKVGALSDFESLAYLCFSVTGIRAIPARRIISLTAPPGSVLKITADQDEDTIKYLPGYLSIRREDGDDGKIRYLLASANLEEGIGPAPKPCTLTIEETETGESIQLEADYYEMDIPDGDSITKYEIEASEPVDIVDQYLSTDPSWTPADIR